MIRINIILLTLLWAVFIPNKSSALSAEQILDNTSKLLRTSPSLTIKFSVKGNNSSGNGTITMSGNMFIFDSDDICVWYNGTNQWTLQRSVDEVSLTSPTTSELIESNPFAIISKHKQLYTSKVISSSPTTYKIQLTPRNRHSQISSAIITINALTFMPSALSCTLSDKSVMNVTINSTSKGKALAKSHFTFNTKAYPNTELIDLR